MCRESIAPSTKSELEEVVHTCDRVAVLRDRKKVGELSGDGISEQRIMEMVAHREWENSSHNADSEPDE